MAQALGRRVKIWRVPAGWVRAVARAGDALRLPLNSERLKKLTESYIVSNSKIKKALGWAAMPVSAQEGMRKTLESFGASSLTEARSSQRPND
jgi:nucleoside-diphosphate-sugar epimerase